MHGACNSFTVKINFVYMQANPDAAEPTVCHITPSDFANAASQVVLYTCICGSLQMCALLNQHLIYLSTLVN